MGDDALVNLASLCNSVVRESDIVARLGGDEFVVMLNQVDLIAAQEKVQQLLRAIDTFNQRRPLPFDLSIAYGIVAYDKDRYPTLDHMLAAGDAVMYQYKVALRVRD